MKRLSLAIILACCTLVLAAQDAIRVNYQGAAPTISDFAWAFLSSNDHQEEEDCADESFNAIRQAWIQHRKGLPQQEGVNALCENLNVPVYEMIIEKIKREVSSIELDKNRVLLYHGSKSGLVGDIKPISRERCDFGKGFYMGTTPDELC